MKKILSTIIILSALLGALSAGTAIAGPAEDTDLSGYLVQEEDAVNPESSETGRETAYLMDTAGLLSDQDAAEVEKRLQEVSETCGFPVYMLTAGSFNGASAEEYADAHYYAGGLGTGEDRSGLLLLLSMEEREVYLYTKGMAARYLTDNAINYIFDQDPNGMISSLSNGSITAAAFAYAGYAEMFYLEGIYEDQADVYEDGTEDYYYPQKKKDLNVIEIAISAIIAMIAGAAPVQSIKKKYAMKQEKMLSRGFNLSYRQNAVLSFASTQDDLIDKHIRSIPLPVIRNDMTGMGGRGQSGSGFGGGHSTMHSGMGGGFHGGGGRKF